MWPLASGAQQPTMPVIGFLDSRSPDAISERLRAFRQGLKWMRLPMDVLAGLGIGA